MTDTYEFHPLADIFPLMEGAEFDALVEDIKTNGLHEQIMLYEGKILDGRNRYLACLKAKVPQALGTAFDLFEDIHPGCSEADARAYVISKNINRRHLTPEVKRDALVKLVAAQPGRSDRDIARELGVHHSAVGRAREKGEATGAVATVERRKGADGKTRRKPAAKKKSGSKRGRAQRERHRRRTSDPRYSIAPDMREFWPLENEKGERVHPVWSSYLEGTVRYMAQLSTLGKKEASEIAAAVRHSVATTRDMGQATKGGLSANDLRFMSANFNKIADELETKSS